MYIWIFTGVMGIVRHFKSIFTILISTMFLHEVLTIISRGTKPKFIIASLICLTFLLFSDRYCLFSFLDKNAFFVKVTINGIKHSASAYYDSGNMLIDPYTKNPVIIITNNFYSKTTKQKTKENTTLELLGKEGFYAISTDTVNGTSILPCFKIQKLSVSSGKKTYIYRHVTAAICSIKLPGNSDILLHKSMHP